MLNDPNNFGRFNPGGFAISSIAVDPHDITGQTVYASAAGFSGDGLTEQVSQPLVYLSSDAGQHWSNITSNLLDIPVNALAVDPNTANVVYVGTDIGVYVASDVTKCVVPQNNCWSRYGAGLPPAPVLTLIPYTGSGEAVLRAGTYGRGVWQTALATPASGAGGTTSATAQPATLVFTASVGVTTAFQPVTLTNTGSTDLQIGQVVTTTDFVQQSNCPASLISGATCTVNVAFAPSVQGARSGTLTIPANVAGGQLTVALTGTAGAPASVVLTPSQLNFGSALVGSRTAPQYVTVANEGGNAVSLGTPVVTGSFVLDLQHLHRAS